MPESDIYKRHGLVREEMGCHSCGKRFIASINFDMNGNHEIECPWCHHKHFRKIVNGHVTQERYSSDPRVGMPPDSRSMWKSTTVPIETQPTANSWLRERWMNYGREE